MNYRDELYLNIIKKFHKKYHRSPTNEEAKKIGINNKYICLKYGSIKDFCNKNKIVYIYSRSRKGVKGKFYKRNPQIYYIYNKNKKELIDRGRYFDLFFDYIFDLGGNLDTFKMSCMNKRAYKGFIILGEWQHRVYDLCDRDWKLYLIAMYFLFDTDYYKCVQVSATKIWQEKIIKPIEKGVLNIEDFLGDVSRFDETIQYMKDFKAGKIILRDYDKYGVDVERLKTPEEVEEYMNNYIKERGRK